MRDDVLVAMLDAMMALKDILLVEKIDIVKAERLVSEKVFSKEILMAWRKVECEVYMTVALWAEGLDERVGC